MSSAVENAKEAGAGRRGELDLRWHPSRLEASGLPPYIHFLTEGADAGLCPSRAMLAVYNMNDSGAAPTLADFTRIVGAVRKISKRLSAQRCLALIAFFTPHLYEGGDADEVSGSAGIRRFVHFLETGLWEGLTPGRELRARRLSGGGVAPGPHRAGCPPPRREARRPSPSTGGGWGRLAPVSRGTGARRPFSPSPR